MVTLHTIVTQLKSRGYEWRFRRDANNLVCVELKTIITPDNFNVDETFHFEDASHTDQERILYAISSSDGVKGILVEAWFVYEDNISPEMFKKLNHHENL